LLNSLYGKFGQRGGKWETIGKDDVGVFDYRLVFDDHGNEWKERTIAGVVQRKEEVTNSYNALVAISAGVTANARAFLYTLIEEAGLKNVYYVDTDSLIVNDEGLTRLHEYLDDTRLGALKVEATFDKLVIYALKDYEAGSKVRRKGVPSKAMLLDDGSFEYECWPRLATLARKGTINRYFTFDTRKTLARTYDKGVVGPDGWVSPITINAGV
jgi:hypothetical protein